tara:strand:- start:3156 stop:3668 length:513 start_codon:yes stop_codon:yes gene_type:complete
MIKIIDNFFDNDMLEKIKYHVATQLTYTPRYFEDTKEKIPENYYGDRYELRNDTNLLNTFIENAEKKFKIKIKRLSKFSGVDMRNLDVLKPHTDETVAKINILIMIKGNTAVTNGTVFYTDNNLDMHIGFKENRALMFPSNKVHSPHASTQPGIRRYTSTLFIEDYETSI